MTVIRISFRDESAWLIFIIVPIIIRENTDFNIGAKYVQMSISKISFETVTAEA